MIAWIKLRDWRISDLFNSTYYESFCGRFKITYCASRNGYYLNDKQNPHDIATYRPIYTLNGAKQQAQLILLREISNGSDGTKQEGSK